MSTRCAAGMLEPGGKVTWIYIHQQGYVKGGTGEILMRHYWEHEKAETLLNHGSASIIAPDLEDCTFHARDWRRKKWGPETVPDIPAYLQAAEAQTCDFAYLHHQDKWHIVNSAPEDGFILAELTGETVQESERRDYRMHSPRQAGAARQLLTYTSRATAAAASCAGPGRRLEKAQARA